MGWLIGLTVASSIFGAFRRRSQAQEAREARAKLAEIQTASQRLGESKNIEDLEKERDTTVSRQQARTGRGGLTAEGSPLAIEQSILDAYGSRGVVSDKGTITNPITGVSVDISEEEVVGGSGAIGYVQQQGVLDRAAIEAGEDLANIGSYSNADLGLDILSTTLDAATSIYAYNYQFQQTQIPDPYRPFTTTTGLDAFYGDTR